MTPATLRLLTPEIVLMAAAVTIYIGGAFLTARRLWSWIAGCAVLLAMAALWSQHGPVVADGPLALDGLAWYGRWLALGLGALLVLLASKSLHCNGGAFNGAPEYVGSLLLTVAGLMLVACAGELVLLFVALELISIPTYVLLYLGRHDAAHQESAAKYFFLSVLASATLLYGFSFLYGVAGSTELTAIGAALDGTKPLPAGFDVFAKLALALILAGLCFKIAAVPFHFYAPDVYQGTTYTNATLLSVVPKAAGFLALARMLLVAMPGMEPYAWRLVLAISVLTMTFGNVVALWQDDLRRLLAYSSIAQAGYMLLALAAGLAAGGTSGGWDGIGALWFYLVTYAAATIGAFAVLEHLGRPERRLDTVEELAGLARARPAAAAVLAMCMFSLAGVPPLAGFWGKFLVFGGALWVDAQAGAAGNLRWWFVAAAIVGVLNAAVAAAYYLRIVAVMYFRSGPSAVGGPSAAPRAQGGAGAWWAAVACALLLVGVGVYPGPLMRQVDRASGQRPMPSTDEVRSVKCGDGTSHPHCRYLPAR